MSAFRRDSHQDIINKTEKCRQRARNVDCKKNFKEKDVHSGDWHKAFERAEDLIIRSIIGNVIALSHSRFSIVSQAIIVAANRIHIPNDSGKAGET
jgi:hypothetical protein